MDNDNRELQSKLLVMLKWFHSFCVSNDLRYYVLGGTMLGAIRHKGFIPWDDDVDVGMPRSDYNRLYLLLKNKQNEPFILETPHSSARDFTFAFSKLYDSTTTLVENTSYKIKRGIYIDIFPLDGMGNTEEESRKTFSIIDRKFKFLLAHTLGIKKSRSILKNASIVISQTILTPFINDKKLIQALNQISSTKDFDSCVFGGNPFGNWRYKEIMETAIMGKPTLYHFEDTQIYGAENAEKYLSHLYGDWKKLPPLEKQQSHHDYISLDLHQSYIK